MYTLFGGACLNPGKGTIIITFFLSKGVVNIVSFMESIGELPVLFAGPNG